MGLCVSLCVWDVCIGKRELAGSGSHLPQLLVQGWNPVLYCSGREFNSGSDSCYQIIYTFWGSG